MVHYLKNDPGPQQVPKFESEENQPNSSFNNVTATNNYTQHHQQQRTEEKNDLALGYTFVNVKDEENEGKLQVRTQICYSYNILNTPLYPPYSYR